MTLREETTGTESGHSEVRPGYNMAAWTSEPNNMALTNEQNSWREI
jgi:hypothetical protein